MRRWPDVPGQTKALVRRARESGTAAVVDVRERVVLAGDVRKHGPLAAAARLGLRSDRPLPMYWWAGETNFGDILSPVITAYVSGMSPRPVHSRRHGKVVAVGSVLFAARPGDVVWGAGSVREQPVDLDGTVVLAVRGPLTAALVRGDVAPAVHGDPAVLLPRLHAPRELPNARIGLVPHLVDRAIMTSGDPAVRVIDLGTRDWRSVVDQIAACDVVLSSSLHGVIVAEAYGVPAVWTKASDGVVGDGFKFRDYYAATDRDVGQARLWGAPLADLVDSAVAPPAIDGQRLVDAWRAHFGPMPAETSSRPAARRAGER